MNRKETTKQRVSDTTTEADEDDTTATESEHVCPECGGDVHEVDNEHVCTDCQLIVDDQVIDHGPEWRAFNHEESQQKRRVGPSQTLRRHDSLSTTIDWRDKDGYGQSLSAKRRQQFNRLRKWDSRSKFGSGDRALADGLTEIQRMGSALNISKDVQETASALYRRAQDDGVLPGRSIESVSAASLYAAARMHDIPRVFDSVVSVSRLSNDKRIWSAYKELQRTLELEINLIHPTDYVPQIVEELGVFDADLKRVLRLRTETIINEAMDAGIGTGGMSPIVFVATAVYVAGETLPIKITQKHAATAAGSSTVSIRNHYQEVKDTAQNTIESSTTNASTITSVSIDVESCTHCDETFKSDVARTVHIDRSHFICEYCGDVFDSDRGLAVHKGQLHPEEKLREDYNGEYDCDHCPKGFDSNRALQNHLSVAHTQIKSQQDREEAAQGEYDCPYCHHAFDTGRGLDIHKGLKHPAEFATEPDPEPKKQTVGEFNCDFCDRAFDTEHGRKTHVSLVHPDQCTDDNPEDDFEYDCPFCDRAFETERGRDIHAGTQHPEQKRAAEQQGDYECSFCDAAFETERGLTTHIGKKHPEQTKPDDAVDCSECDEWFETTRARNIHIAHVHENTDSSEEDRSDSETATTDDEGIPCPYCENVFESDTGRNIHIGQSHPERPLPGEVSGEHDCPECDRAFDSKRGVRSHLAKVHPDAFAELQKEKREEELRRGEHDCPYCIRAYDKEHALHTHVGQEHPAKVDEFRIAQDTEATAGDHECPHCPRAFDTYQGRRIHESNAHPDAFAESTAKTGEYDCPICDAGFDSERGRDIHVGRMHPDFTPEDEVTTDAAYTCPYCDAGLNDLTGLQNHLSHAHRGDTLKSASLTFDGLTTCTTCDREFDTYSGLAKHIGLSHDVVAMTDARAKRIIEFTDQLVAAGNRDSEITEMVEEYVSTRDALPTAVGAVVAAGVLTRLASERTSAPVSFTALGEVLPVTTSYLHQLREQFEAGFETTIDNN